MDTETNRQILVVEDDDGLRSLIIRNLNRAGYTAKGVVNGAQAIEAIANDQDCLVLLDQKLPDMTGSEIIFALKERNIKFTFIIMTGHGDERLAVEMMKLGAYDYLVKDIDFTDILQGVLERVFRNIDTERKLKETENALKSSEAKLRSLLAAMPDLIVVLNSESKIVEIAPTAAGELLGNIDGLVGKEINHVLPQDLADTFRDAILDVIDNETQHTIDYFMTVENKSRCFSAKISPLTKDKVLWVARDITDRKLAELEIIELNENLELKVAERTSELNKALQLIENSNIELRQLNDNIATEARSLQYLNEKLVDSEHQLKIANQTKDKFFSIIAHDIRNPLTALQLSAEFLDTFFDRLSLEQCKSNIKGLYDSSLNLSDLINNLLTWAKTQTDNIEFHSTKVNINNAIDEVINTLQNNIEQKNLKVNIKYTSFSELYADANMLNSIIGNLLSNAIKFTVRGGEIEIGVEKFNRENINANWLVNFSSLFEYTHIYIKDSGIGMGKEKLEKLFKLGEKVTQKGTEGESSTGLGLLLCKEFVEKHSGRIWVESELDKGSIFHFILPYQSYGR
jgi:PAS domain S-box-containing protein